MIKEIMRMLNKTCIYLEICKNDIIPFIWNEMHIVKNRRFPHFLEKKWDHERAEHTLKDQPHPSDNRDA
jgi:hypothetical protein